MKGEDRTGLRIGRLAASPVGPHDRIHDRKPQPRSAVGAGTGGVGAGEAVEQPLEPVGGQPGALVCDLDREP